jgi:putative SOS response-associated peptidase YedK
MCGRFTLAADANVIQEAFPWLNIPGDLRPRFNVAPTQPVAVVPNDGKNQLDYFVWGLIPSWAKDPEIGNPLINARAETLAEKPSFRSSLKRKRCLILADGFYEWKQIPGQKSKQPMYIRLKSGQLFAFAGLWDEWHAPDGSQVLSCTIITTAPNSMMQEIHNRMPVILSPGAYAAWLAQGEQKPEVITSFLQSYPAEEMTAYPVSSLVNSPNNDSPELISPRG